MNEIERESERALACMSVCVIGCVCVHVGVWVLA